MPSVPRGETTAPTASVLHDRPDWLIERLLQTRDRGWRRDRLAVPDDASRDDVRDLLVQRVRDLEREAGPRILFVDWTLEAEPAPLRRLLDPDILAGLLAEVRRAATGEPRIVWPAGLVVVPSARTAGEWAERGSYLGLFVQRRQETLATPDAAIWSDDDVLDLSGELAITPDELRSFLVDDTHESSALGEAWNPALTSLLLDRREDPR
jgi:hypothetical protein